MKSDQLNPTRGMLNGAGHPDSRLRVGSFALLALFLFGSRASAQPDPWSFTKMETLFWYIEIGVHGAPVAAHPHVEAPAAAWWATVLNMDLNPGPPGTTIYSEDAVHFVPPHPWLGEGAGPLWSIKLPVIAGIGAPGVARNSMCGALWHGPAHKDSFLSTVAMNYNAAGVNKGAISVSVGVHPEDEQYPRDLRNLCSVSSGADQVPPNPSEAFGVAGLVIDTGNNAFTITFVVRGVLPTDVLGAHIHLGSAGVEGPVIFDLGPGAMWDDLDGIGIGRIMGDQVFPPEYVSALLAGTTYVDLHTLMYPDGEIRGQLVEPPSVLWDTGAPHAVIYNGNPTYLGYSSGNLPAMPQRWAAVPFSIPSGGAVINRIDADWFINPGYEAETINYIIWQRTGLAPPQPGDERAVGALGPYGPGLDDPRTPDPDDWLHIYDGLDIWLPGGDYYFTLYAAGIGPGNTTGFSDAPWVTGGDLQDEDLEQPFLWRSSSFPTPGFEPYDNPAIQPAPGQDPDDRWNPSFAIYGLVNSLGHKGDLNCDGSVDFGDINPFVLFLSNYGAWVQTYPACPPENGDINGDGLYPSFGDINPFVALLTGG